MAESLQILVVDDDEGIRVQLSGFLEECGYRTITAESGEEALDLLRADPCRIALVDHKMPGMDGLELVQHLRARYPEMVLIMMTAYGTVESAVAAMKAGVHDYLLKPIGPDPLQHKLGFVAEKIRAEDELASLRNLVRERYRFDRLIGASAKMQNVFSLIESAAVCDLSVLITGETGTGKELTARAIHVNSARRERPFVGMNCAAVPEGLMESELFGHVRGAFTGASQARLGKLASAQGGTLLLDELSAAPESFQVRLLRVLEEMSFTPVGSDETMEVDIRVIATMNTAAEEEVRSGALRRDLFYRLNVLRIDLPALRERREDIPLLVRDVLERYAQRGRQEKVRVSPGFVDELMAWHWPGNVRELQNAVEAALAVSDGNLSAGDIPTALLRGREADAQASTGPTKLRDFLANAEQAHIEDALRQTDGNMRRAARLLAIGERSLRRKLSQYGIDRLAFRARKS
ncbi:MAG: sigma-54-dependent Fis family transcriptional regulator [Deltaproteobacteria bacterium]|nr:sigma-54-dependent Fis family transcriptional regulator [Deltaproteobacteria bacterium]